MYLRQYLFVTILSACCFEWIASYTFNEKVCVYEKFYDPYIKVYQIRNGAPIFSKLSKGFADLRTFSGILCVNGPAFLYTNLSIEETINGTVKLFSPNPAEIVVYNHDCMTFNRRKNMDCVNGPVEITKTTDVIAGDRKVYGIYLFAHANDYRIPNKHFFTRYIFGFVPVEDNYGHSHLLGSSFAFTSVPSGKLQIGFPLCNDSASPACDAPTRVVNGPNAFCMDIRGNHTTLIFVPRPSVVGGVDTAVVCTLQPDGKLAEYFPINTAKGIYDWTPCEEDYGSTLDDQTETPFIDELDDFRIIDPVHKTARGTGAKNPRPGYPGYVVRKAASRQSPTYEKSPFPGSRFNNGRDSNLSNGQTQSQNITQKCIKTYVTECQTVPQAENNCSPEENDKACELLNQVMAIDEDSSIKWHPGFTDNKPNTPASPADEIAEGSWRKRLLNYIEEIYIKACPQIPEHLAPAITRLIEYYLYTAITDTTNDSFMDLWKKSGVENDTQWYFYYDELQRCSESTMKMKFQRIKVNEARTKSEKLQNVLANLAKSNLTEEEFAQVFSQVREELTTDRALKFPFTTNVATPDDTMHTTPKYYEAAQVDYNFNWAIDTYWKMLVTVLGYCNKVYFESKGLSIAFHTEVNYDKDIFDFLKPKWLNVEEADADNEVFDQLFGLYKHELPSVYIDMCMESSYVAAGLENAERPIRNVPLRPAEDDADASPSTNYANTNFFICKQKSTPYQPKLQQRYIGDQQNSASLSLPNVEYDSDENNPTPSLSLPNTEYDSLENNAMLPQTNPDGNLALPNTEYDSLEDNVMLPQTNPDGNLALPNTDYDSLESLFTTPGTPSLSLPNTEYDSLESNSVQTQESSVVRLPNMEYNSIETNSNAAQSPDSLKLPNMEYDSVERT